MNKKLFEEDFSSLTEEEEENIKGQLEGMSATISRGVAQKEVYGFDEPPSEQ